MNSRLSFYTPAESQRLLSQLQTESVNVLGVQFLRVPGFGLLPVVRVDVRDRPDLADLGRIHRTEGDGDHVNQFEFVGSFDGAMLAVLRLELLRPVHAELLLPFDVGHYRQWLRGVVKVGVLGTLFENPLRPRAEQHDLIGWQIDVGPLADALAMHDIARQRWPQVNGPTFTRQRSKGRRRR